MDIQSHMLEQMLLQTYFDIIPFGIYVVDVHSYEILFMNKQMRSQFPETDQAKPCHEALYAENGVCSHCKMPFLVDEKGLPNNQIFTYEYYNEVHECWFQMHEKAIGWPDGRTVKYTIAVDISELKATQNRLAEAHAELALRNKALHRQNEVLQENVRLREDMDRMMRHDLKTPLGPILGLTDALVEEYPNLPEDVIDGMRLVSQAGAQMLEMINHSQTMVHLERGTYVLSPERFDVLELVRRVGTDLDGIAEERGVGRVVLLNGGPLAEAAQHTIRGERLLCYSLFSNLFKNALEASVRGQSIQIDVREEPDGDLVVRIANQGEVDISIRDRFFEKYATFGKAHGTGLGTYSARLIARAHGGEVFLDHAKAGHTVVVIRLPQGGADAAGGGRS